MPEIGNEKIIIVPDEILGILPFEALVSDTGEVKVNQSGIFPYPEGVTFTGDNHTIIYYQSASALSVTRNLNKGTGTEGLIAVADPVFDEDEDPDRPYKVMAVMDENIARLAFTGEIAGKLAEIYPGESKIYVRMDANEKNITTADLLHCKTILFATHGILASDIPYIKEPALVLTLVGNEEGYDGFLTMGEVMNMKIGAYVAVLSACKTGMGHITGEGVMGMGRAFQYAGVRSVIMSLWSVEEKSATMLTEKFFQYLKEGNTPTEALRKAKNYIKSEGYRHPAFWAPFIIVGD